jgi:serpin B
MGWQTRSLFRAWCVVVATGLSLSGAAPQASAPVDGRIKTLTEAYNASGQQLFGQFAASSDNVVFSPYSIGAAMAMALAGARGATETEMLSALEQKLSPSEINAANAAARAVLGGYDNSAMAPECPPASTFSDGRCEASRLSSGRCPPPLELSDDKCVGPPTERPSAALALANALVQTPGAPPVADEYKALLERDYAAETFNAVQLDDINAWVSRRTQGKIDSILSELQPNATVLLNAVYFKAHWRSQFIVSETQDEAFHLDGSHSVQTPTMHMTAAFALARQPGFRAVALPYDVGGIEMVVVLPDATDGAAAIARPLDAPHLDALFAALQTAEGQLVDLALPKFKARFAADHVETAFQRLGMVEAFDHNRADFSGVTGQPVGPVGEERLFISQIAHRAMVDVTESGTEAAAATAVVLATRMAALGPPPARFHVDHPFLFYVLEETTGAILFQGRIVDPRQS